MKPGRRRQRGDEMRSVGRASGHIGKFYAVRKGRQTGIFHSWRDCQAQVSYPSAQPRGLAGPGIVACKALACRLPGRPEHPSRST